jgi:hypothetical protein
MAQLMRGFALNRNLLAVGATFVHEAMTAPIYRLWSIDDQYPAMLRVTAGGAAMALEVWAVPMIHLGTILLQEPPGLGLGKILLADQSIILGVLGEAYMCEGKRDITAWGGWRLWRRSPRRCLMPARYIAAQPYPWPYNGDLRPANTALLVIDMQTDFCGVAAMSIAWAMICHSPVLPSSLQACCGSHAPERLSHLAHR